MQEQSKEQSKPIAVPFNTLSYKMVLKKAAS